MGVFIQGKNFDSIEAELAEFLPADPMQAHNDNWAKNPYLDNARQVAEELTEAAVANRGRMDLTTTVSSEMSTDQYLEKVASTASHDWSVLQHRDLQDKLLSDLPSAEQAKILAAYMQVREELVWILLDFNRPKHPDYAGTIQPKAANALSHLKR